MAKKLVKTDYMRLGMSLAGVPINNKTADLIIAIYEGIAAKQDKFSLSDSIQIEAEIDAKYARLERAKKKVSFEKEKK